MMIAKPAAATLRNVAVRSQSRAVENRDALPVAPRRARTTLPPTGQAPVNCFRASTVALTGCMPFIKQHSARSEIDLARFFCRLVVFVLVGNCDAMSLRC
jgi:hypothetical protein